ncbi:MAG: Methylthioribose-1-phosphate isomerase [Planctomycetes bacterium]|nr:Methylthioribose-1-phosphate isomerase [Planctomycetota bacterium]
MPETTPQGAVPTVAWRSASPDGLPGAVHLLDQTRLPHASVELACADVETLRDAIRRLAVRGAPAIGVAAAYGLVLGVQGVTDDDGVAPALAHAANRLVSARPTAVNLAWAVSRCLAACAGIDDRRALVRRLLAEARTIHAEDEAACLAMGRHGAALLPAGGTFLTHCNTGRLATAGIGTAFGVLATAHAAGRVARVYVGEVRPLLQGARLTAFELAERGIPGTLVPDTAVGALLARGGIDGVLVGADRIARNGDSANKIGTYQIAVLARRHGVPFHVVAPTSTIDRACPDGSHIEIEERPAAEVLGFGGSPSAPPGFPAWNPAFDVTPAGLISSIVTERGVHRAPFSF